MKKNINIWMWFGWSTPRNAARRLNFDVYITDIKSSQFKIFKEKLYIF